MDKEEIMMLTIFVVSFILATIITWRIWPFIKKKMEKSRFGKLVLGVQTPRGSNFLFFVHTLVWGAIMFLMLLIWAIFTS